ncbi:glycerol-3-phosphate dehydrogenase [Tepidimonas sp.]|uniref:glycerol-3-phosphate dehydrogenase n=1 Tax=Tepidimonas sp. TaxID=2002775 RepID=UPI00391D4CA2
MDVDVLIIGGGINGCGIARDLSGRGARVLLCEQDDLAAHTSSASTKLIHGGLRYLEHGELGLVRKALAEREVLLRIAPHLIEPLRFVMPHDAGMRPAWMIRLGLWLYDHLARRELLPGSQSLDLRRDPAAAALQPCWHRAFAYSDGWTDDARLVVLNAVDAARRGCTVLTRTRCERLLPLGDHWHATLRTADDRTLVARARAVVNAAGPWAERLLREVAGLTARQHLRLVRGSHIVVPRRDGHDTAYLLQASDRRVLFAIPYEQRFTLIGTTDVEHHGDPGQAVADAREIEYLCREASRFLRQPVQPTDVVWHYSGVRPLLDDGSDASAVTRDYRLEWEAGAGAPVLTVWGGKITTYRTLALEAARRLGPALGLDTRRDWTAEAHLPGGDLEAVVGPGVLSARQRFAQHLRQRWLWLDEALAARWARSYGTLALTWLDGARTATDLGTEVAPGLYEIELHHLARHEWARTVEDVLWRRSKLGLHLDARAAQRVAAWLARHAPST